MSADPKTSAGARLDRRAFRDYLRRQLRIHGDVDRPYSNALRTTLAWVLKRQERYDRAVGGLGKKGVRR